MKENKGVTLISLAIMVFVLIILASVSIYSGREAIHYVRFQNAKSQMETINSKVGTLYTQYKNGDNAILDYGQNTTSCNQELLTKTFEAGGVDLTKRAKYRYFSKDYIKNELDINGVSNDYLVNIADRDVLLLGGINYQETEYYTLNDFGIKNVK